MLFPCSRLIIKLNHVSFSCPSFRGQFCLFEGIFKQMIFLLFKNTRVLKAVILSFKILRHKTRSFLWLSFTVYHIQFLSEMPQNQELLQFLLYDTASGYFLSTETKN